VDNAIVHYLLKQDHSLKLLFHITIENSAGCIFFGPNANYNDAHLPL